MSGLFHVIALVIAIWVFAGCGNVGSQLTRNYRNLPVWDRFEDFGLVSSVKSQLAGDPSVNSTRIEITSVDRIVHVNGARFR